MKILRVVLILLAVAFLAIQFVRPEKNAGATDPAGDVSAAVPVPDEIAGILRESCYDCHSNSTRYPWYAEVMPSGWYLADHIDEGKSHLNFSEFAASSLPRQYHKLEEISEMVEKGEMPLSSYLLLHRDAALSAREADLLVRWTDDSRSWMKAKYPPDSLERRR